jgi:hypothetical protein
MIHIVADLCADVYVIVRVYSRSGTVQLARPAHGAARVVQCAKWPRGAPRAPRPCTVGAAGRPARDALRG